MPSLRSLRRVRLVWLLRALAFCCCWYVIVSAVRSSSALPAFIPNDHDCTRAAAAVRIWQTVNSGFFPPLLADAFQEQMGHGRQGLVSDQAAVFSPFIMIKAQFGFLVFKTTFYVPTREGHQQQRLQSSFWGCVADKIFDLLRFENVACYEQMTRRAGVAVLQMRVKAYVFHLPNHRSLVAVLDPEPPPGLIAQRRTIPQQIGDARRAALHTQAAALTLQTRRFQPTAEAYRRLGHVALPPMLQLVQKLRLAPVICIERQPGKGNAIRQRPVQQLQSDLPFGPIDDLIGDAGQPAAGPVIGPGLRQKQVAGEQAVKVIYRIAQMNCDDTILDLAAGATVLPLHSGSPVAFLGTASFINHAHGTRAGMVAGDQLLHSIHQTAVVPFQQRQELLQRAWRHARGQSHGLDTLARQVGELPAYIHGQVRPRARVSKTIAKLTQVATKLRSQSANLLGVHARSSQVLDIVGAWGIPLRKARPGL